MSKSPTSLFQNLEHQSLLQDDTIIIYGYDQSILKVLKVTSLQYL